MKNQKSASRKLNQGIWYSEIYGHDISIHQFWLCTDCVSIQDTSTAHEGDVKLVDLKFNSLLGEDLSLRVPVEKRFLRAWEQKARQEWKSFHSLLQSKSWQIMVQWVKISVSYVFVIQLYCNIVTYLFIFFCSCYC